MTRPHPHPDDPGAYDVPAGETPHVCERCGRPLPTERLLALHRGVSHDDLDEAERGAYADAYREETAAIRRFRLLALGAVVVLYFGLLLTYAVVARGLTGGDRMRAAFVLAAPSAGMAQTDVRRASPWPLPLVLGLVLAELGVLYGSLPVSLGGSLLLGASTVGIFRESGYAATLHRPALAVGAVFAALGALVLEFTTATARGTYVAAAGALLLAAGAVLWLVESGRL